MRFASIFSYVLKYIKNIHYFPVLQSVANIIPLISNIMIIIVIAITVIN